MQGLYLDRIGIWKHLLVFEEGGKPEYQGKKFLAACTPTARQELTANMTHIHVSMATGWNET